MQALKRRVKSRKTTIKKRRQKSALTTLRWNKTISAQLSTKVPVLMPTLPFLVKYKELRFQVIKEVFRGMTGDWGRNHVIYPISGHEDIILMM